MKRQPLGRGLEAILGSGSKTARDGRRDEDRNEAVRGAAAADPSADTSAGRGSRPPFLRADDSLGSSTDRTGEPTATQRAAATANDAPRLVAVERIVAGRGQPRRKFAEQPLEELAQSIREKGIIQPLIVTEGPGGYELIAGERRLRAATRAGLERVPVIIKRDVAYDELLELALIENIQREDLTPMEESRAYQRLIDDHGYTQDELGTKIGKSRAAVSNTLRLLGLPDPVQQLVDGGQISEGHARALLRFGSSAEQIRYARKCAQDGLSVREIEEIAKRASVEGGGPGRTRRGAKQAGPRGDLEEALTRKLATKVKVKQKGDGGTIEISYHSTEELTRLVDRMGC